jgi:Pyridoxamine 5'-phosphate oxidase
LKHSSLPVRWPDDIDEVLDADVVVALAYRTPAGGVVISGVSPIGLRDRDAGTVGFTTSLGFGRKLERIRRNPQVALAFHAREHGWSRRADYVLVQGTVSEVLRPGEAYLRQEIGKRSERYLGAPRRGLFWDRWLRVYYRDRVLVTVQVERIVRWPRLDGGGEPEVIGSPLPEGGLRQSPPKQGTGPRIESRRAERRLGAVPHRLLGFVQADGLPMVVAITITAADGRGLTVRTAGPVLPAGGLRAGVLGHKFYEHVAGLTSRQYTGWLTVDAEDASTGIYAPHTERNLVIPHSKTIALLLNGLAATTTYRAAQKAGRERLLDRS